MVWRLLFGMMAFVDELLIRDTVFILNYLQLHNDDHIQDKFRRRSITGGRNLASPCSSWQLRRIDVD